MNFDNIKVDIFLQDEDFLKLKVRPGRHDELMKHLMTE